MADAQGGSQGLQSGLMQSGGSKVWLWGHYT